MLRAFHNRLDILKIMFDAQVFFVSVQNLERLNYVEVNDKRSAFCLKISFQSKTGICLQIAKVLYSPVLYSTGG